MNRPDTRILNVSRNTRLKLHQAEARVLAGVAAWVDARSIRDLTLVEVLERRVHEARMVSPRELVGSELPGIVVQWPTRIRAELRNRGQLLQQARQFCEAAG